MATATLSVLSYADGACEIHLVYDTTTLRVAQLAGANSTQHDAFAQLQNGSVSRTVLLPAGGGGSVGVPAGALTLVQQPADGGTVLSYAPWSIFSRWPA